LPNRDTDKGISYVHPALNRWEPMPRLVNPGNDRCNPVVSSLPIAQSVAVADAVVTAERPASQEAAPVDEFQIKLELAELCIDKIRKLEGRKTTFAKIKKTLSVAQRLVCDDLEFQELLMDDEAIGVETEAMRNGLTTIRLWWIGDER
jgi:hypothetical protein